MKAVMHKAETRGHANYGWLNTYYTFSFADYYNPERIHFGALRVLNDDWIAGGQGFGRHPHDNMEIVTIPLEGELEHKDSMGNTFRLKENDIQIMSAGTGVFHSEYNKLPDNPARLLQIWVFPKKKNIIPRYDQKTFNPEDRKNHWQRIVSPNEPEAIWINQEAYFSMISLGEQKRIDYNFRNSENGVYIFLLEGLVDISGYELNRRDGIGLWQTSATSISAQKSSEVLLIEVPMKV